MRSWIKKISHSAAKNSRGLFFIVVLSVGDCSNVQGFESRSAFFVKETGDNEDLVVR